jgi:hypothetical protein
MSATRMLRKGRYWISRFGRGEDVGFGCLAGYRRLAAAPEVRDEAAVAGHELAVEVRPLRR